MRFRIATPLREDRAGRTRSMGYPHSYGQYVTLAMEPRVCEKTTSQLRKRGFNGLYSQSKVHTFRKGVGVHALKILRKAGAQNKDTQKVDSAKKA